MGAYAAKSMLKRSAEYAAIPTTNGSFADDGSFDRGLIAVLTS
jgi:hypothetical protein